MQAVLFLYYSSFSFLGKGDMLRFGFAANKLNLLKNIKGFLKEISGNQKTEISYLNCNYLDVLEKISIKKGGGEIKKTFIFADPPYIETAHNYDTPEWTMKNHAELQTYLVDSGNNFMICEFGHPEVLALAKQNGLYVTEIAERRNLGNRRTEIIITNYETDKYIQKSLF